MSNSFNPREFVLDPHDLGSTNEFLRHSGWLDAVPVLCAEKIGDGNMNFTVRAHTADGSYILKQARPWVVKYPQIPAPVERAAVEASFYRLVASTPALSSQMPILLGFSEEAHVLRLQDLGDAGDYMSCYRSGEFDEKHKRLC